MFFLLLLCCRCLGRFMLGFLVCLLVLLFVCLFSYGEFVGILFSNYLVFSPLQEVLISPGTNKSCNLSCL